MARTKRSQTARKARNRKALKANAKFTSKKMRKQVVKKAKQRTTKLSPKSVLNTNTMTGWTWKLFAMAHHVYTFVKNPAVQCVLRCVLTYITSNNSETCK